MSFLAEDLFGEVFGHLVALVCAHLAVLPGHPGTVLCADFARLPLRLPRRDRWPRPSGPWFPRSSRDACPVPRWLRPRSHNPLRAAALS